MFSLLALPRQLLRFFLLFGGLWLLILLPAAAQSDLPGVRIDRLPPDGLLLSKGWRYHPGDNPAWARPDFDDSRWEAMPVARAGLPLPPQALSGPGWFRLRLRLGDSLRYQALGLLANRTMAGCELYLNGRPIGHYGTFSTNPAQVQPTRLVTQPVLLPPFDPKQELVLAVRFSPWQPGPPLRAYLAQNRLLDLVLWLKTSHEIEQEKTEAGYAIAVSTFVGGVLLLLALLHWVFFGTSRPSPPTAISPAMRWPSAPRNSSIACRWSRCGGECWSMASSRCCSA
jgi:two-component system NtrC family sensor kinase